MKDIAYSIDALIPGFYLWFGRVYLRVGGTKAESNYPGVIKSFAGVAVVLPYLKSLSSYRKSFDAEMN